MHIHFKVFIRTEVHVRKNASPSVHPVQEFDPLGICTERIGRNVIARKIVYLKKYVSGLHGSVLCKRNLKVKFRHGCVGILFPKIFFHFPDFNGCYRLHFLIIISVVVSKDILTHNLVPRASV